MPVEKPLGELHDGAVLGADVLDARGNVLLAGGTRLTRAHLQLLERRGIKSVTVAPPVAAAVEAAASAGPEPARPALAAEWLARQERVFAKVRQDSRMEAIYQAARAHLSAGNLPPG
jgi:hypothetical protein